MVFPEKAPHSHNHVYSRLSYLAQLFDLSGTHSTGWWAKTRRTYEVTASSNFGCCKTRDPTVLVTNVNKSKHSATMTVHGGIKGHLHASLTSALNRSYWAVPRPGSFAPEPNGREAGRIPKVVWPLGGRYIPVGSCLESGVPVLGSQRRGLVTIPTELHSNTSQNVL